MHDDDVVAELFDELASQTRLAATAVGNRNTSSINVVVVVVVVVRPLDARQAARATRARIDDGIERVLRPLGDLLGIAGVIHIKQRRFVGDHLQRRMARRHVELLVEPAKARRRQLTLLLREQLGLRRRRRRRRRYSR